MVGGGGALKVSFKCTIENNHSVARNDVRWDVGISKEHSRFDEIEKFVFDGTFKDEARPYVGFRPLLGCIKS